MFRKGGTGIKKLAGTGREMGRQIGSAGTGDLLQELQRGMDYRLEGRKDGKVPRDALWMAQCLGLPTEVIRYSLSHLGEELEEGGDGDEPIVP